MNTSIIKTNKGRTIMLQHDVYDAALSTSIIPLTEWSVANRSYPVLIPDFTTGSWENNPRAMDIDIKEGGNTRIL